MSSTTEYPQDAVPTKPRRALKVSLASIGTAVVIAAGSFGGVSWANGIAAQQAHNVAVAQQHQVAAALPAMQAQTAAATSEADTSTADQVVATEQAREAAVAQAQAEAAAVAAAAAAKAPAVHHAAVSSSGLPAGAVVPDIPGTTSPDTTQCASGTASNNASGVPVCD